MVHRPIHVQLRRLVDTGSSMHRLSVLLPAVETSLRTCTALEIAQWVLVGIISTHIPVPRVLAVATNRGRLWLLIEVASLDWGRQGGVYVVGKPADSNDGWIRYMRVIQLGLIDAGSSTCSLSVLLSAVETSLRTCTEELPAGYHGNSTFRMSSSALT